MRGCSSRCHDAFQTLLRTRTQAYSSDLQRTCLFPPFPSLSISVLRILSVPGITSLIPSVLGYQFVSVHLFPNHPLTHPALNTSRFFLFPISMHRPSSSYPILGLILASLSPSLLSFLYFALLPPFPNQLKSLINSNCYWSSSSVRFLLKRV